MDEYKKIQQAYRKVLLREGSSGRDAIGYDQQRSQNRGYTPKTDGKNSTALTTSSLPGGTQQLNVAAMGCGSPSIDEEDEVEIKGIGKMKRADIHIMYRRVAAEIREMVNKNKTEGAKEKAELLHILAKHM